MHKFYAFLPSCSLPRRDQMLLKIAQERHVVPLMKQKGQKGIVVEARPDVHVVRVGQHVVTK
eukprot:1480288-Heterocapsa_arctica.AAC.1